MNRLKATQMDENINRSKLCQQLSRLKLRKDKMPKSGIMQALYATPAWACPLDCSPAPTCQLAKPKKL